MEFFPDRAHVRLRSRVQGAGYLHADEDGLRVSLNTERASLNTSWKVHRLVRDGASYVLLYGAAYGRYLALSPRRRGLVQRNYRTPEQDNILWVAARAGDEHGDALIIRHGRHRARYWDVPVDDEANDDRFISTHWEVELIPPTPELPLIPYPTPMEPPFPWRNIVFRRGNGWWMRKRRFLFGGRSVYNLTNIVANHLDEDMDDIVLCVRAGARGRLTPLAVDLPLNQLPMQVVAFHPLTIETLGLRHPDVYAV